MSFLSFIIPPGDRWILLAWFLLCLVSLAVLWSVTEPIHGPYEELDPGVSKTVFFRQMVWMMIGYCALLVASRVPLRYLDNIAMPLFLFSILLLALILLVGPRIGGARRWLVIGPIHLQPSEIAKVTFILVTANILGRSMEERRGMVAALGTFLVMTVPMFLVLRPDPGSNAGTRMVCSPRRASVRTMADCSIQSVSERVASCSYGSPTTYLLPANSS